MRLFAAATASLLVACATASPPHRTCPAGPPMATAPAPMAGWPAPTNAPTAAPTQVSTPAAPPAADRFAAARQRCLDETNAYRARVGAPPLVYRQDKSSCTDTDARGDATNGTIHGGSGRCAFGAQNECPAWSGTGAGIVASCLKSMFEEGPGQPYSEHGHYINMTGRDYRGLACGFYEAGGKVWLVQNFFR